MATLSERVVCVAPSSIHPFHEITRPLDLKTLTKSMKIRGWEGRPLVVALQANIRQALTGSHRWAASKAAGLREIPVVFLTQKELKIAKPGPVHQEVLARMLIRAGHSPIGELMLMDCAIEEFEGRFPNYHPWDWGTGRWLREEGYGEEVADLMRIADWGCPE